MISLENLQDKLYNKPTGTVYNIIIVPSGQQDGLNYGAVAVEVVVLDSYDVAYRYSCDAQDGEWEIGTVEDAYEEAQALKP